MLPEGSLSLLKGFIDLVLPPFCCLCGRTTDGDGICPSCEEGFERVSRPFCVRCGDPFPSREALDHPCPVCIKKPPPFRIARSLALYKGGLAEALQALKFRGKTSLAAPLSRLLSSCDMDFHLYDLLIPVPLHRKRLMARGFNQALLLARGLGRVHSIKVDFRLLKRVKDTPPQTGLHRKERLQNLKGAFAVTDPALLRGKKALLIDDIYTTGTTVRECARVLKKAGVEFVDVLTVARVKGENRG